MRHPDPSNPVSSVIKMGRSERAERSQFQPASTIPGGDQPSAPHPGIEALLPIPREPLKETHIPPEVPDAWGDILIAPDLETANMLAKQLIYLAVADSAGVILGARVPIILTSRADGRHHTAGEQ